MVREMTWAAAVRKLRTEKGWSQGELAIKAGIRGNTLSSALAGKTSPRLNTLEKVVSAQALNVPLWRLFVDDRQADLLQRQEAIDAAVTNESEMVARIEQRLLGKYAEIVKEAMADELSGTGQSVALPAKPLADRPKLAPPAPRRKHAR